MARELINRIQRLRKDSGLEITDRVALVLAGPESVQAAANAHVDFIAGETLATSVIVKGDLEDDTFTHVNEVDIDGTPATIGLSVDE